jgi:hypothetical protein
VIQNTATLFIFSLFSVASLPSAMLRCTQNGALDDAISHYKQTLSTATPSIYRLAISQESFFRDISPVTERQF